MDILANFQDWKKSTATFYEKSSSKDAAGRPVETLSQIGTPQKLIEYTETANESNKNSKFVNECIKTFILQPPGFDIKTANTAVIDGENYIIEGPDDIMKFGEVLKLTVRKGNA